MALKPWIHKERELVADMKVFRVHRVRAQSPRTGKPCDLSLLEAGHWVNVVALTPEMEIVLVRQFRHGIEAFTWEIPGGMVDQGEEPAQAAVRELREETGYAGDAPVLLGSVTPNPALFNNRCYTYLVLNCRRIGAVQLDHGEDLEMSTRPLGDMPGWIAAGGIDHALVIGAFWWLALARPDLLPLAPGIWTSMAPK
jgi:ADP-ribose pyrophosphatase